MGSNVMRYGNQVRARTELRFGMPDTAVSRRLARRCALPLAELEFRASRSGGPGGQHVNTSSTRVEVTGGTSRGSPALSEEQRQRLLARLASRLDGTGRLRLVSSGSRSQLRNREDVTERLREVVAQALVVPKTRKRTAPTARGQGGPAREQAPASGDEAGPAAAHGRRLTPPPVYIWRPPAYADYCGTPCDSSNRASRRCPSPIQTPVLNGLAHVAGCQLIGASEVGDRAGDLEHPVVRPCREAQAAPPPRGADAPRPVRQGTVAPQVSRGHVGVGMQPGPVAEPLDAGGPGPAPPVAARPR